MATSLCDSCVALCCRYFALQIDRPKRAADYDNIRWYLVHDNVVVFIEKGKWFLAVLNKCKHLQPDNRCGIYETRPRICRDYTTDNCEYHSIEYDYEQIFTSAEQLVAYANKQLGHSMIYKPRAPRKVARAKIVKGKKRVRLKVV
jgi:Fe-S-cluster containining protein